MRRPTSFGDAYQVCGSSIGKRNDEENAKEKLYTYASHVPVESFKVSSIHLVRKTFY